MAAFILNFQGPQDADELAYYCDRGDSNVNSVIMDSCVFHCTKWTVPENAKPGDIAILACARTAEAHLGHARAEARSFGDDALVEFANEQMELYRIYSGKLLAIGVIDDGEADNTTGWSIPMRDIINLRMFSRPIDTKELNGVIKLNRFGSVTHLDDRQWSFLRDYINRSELESQVKYMQELSQYDLMSPEWRKKKRPKGYEERKKMSQKLRYEVLRRDGFRCVLCGKTADDGIKLEVDHIKPVSKGGLTVLENLRTLCDECNGGKGSLYSTDSVN